MLIFMGVFMEVCLAKMIFELGFERVRRMFIVGSGKGNFGWEE